MGAEICGTPLLNRPPNSIQPYGTPAEQSFVLVVTNLRLALMLTRGDKDAEVLQQQQQERMNKLARNTPQASLPSRLPGGGDLHQARRDSEWVDARGRWESLCGVWNVIPLGMVLRVSLTDSSVHTSQPSKRSTRHNTSAPPRPHLHLHSHSSRHLPLPPASSQRGLPNSQIPRPPIRTGWDLLQRLCPPMRTRRRPDGQTTRMQARAQTWGSRYSVLSATICDGWTCSLCRWTRRCECTI